MRDKQEEALRKQCKDRKVCKCKAVKCPCDKANCQGALCCVFWRQRELQFN